MVQNQEYPITDKNRPFIAVVLSEKAGLFAHDIAYICCCEGKIVRDFWPGMRYPA